MLLLKMIIRITGFTQEELAKFLDVSRVTVNYWLNGEEISIKSMKNICEKFNFPISYFSFSLNENIEVYRIIYATLYKNWQEMSIVKNNDSNNIDRIINEIEAESKTIYKKSINDDDIIDGLCNGYDPFSGEIFDTNHILNNEDVKRVLLMIKNKYYKYGAKDVNYNDLSSEKRKLFNKFRLWRKDKAEKEGFFGAYMVLNDQELINIVTSNIKRKEDLIGIKGIGEKKYLKYSDDIFKILTEEE